MPRYLENLAAKIEEYGVNDNREGDPPGSGVNYVIYARALLAEIDGSDDGLEDGW